MALIILDRDGVINYDSDDYVKSLEEWRPIPGSIDAIARLTQAGHLIAVATNQSGLGRGYFNQATLNAMHAEMGRLVAKAGGSLHFIAFCPHKPCDNCECRKPKPGLIQQISSALSQKLDRSTWMVGDAFRDLEAAWNTGIQCALVKTGKGKETIASQGNRLRQVPIFENLAHFADEYLKGTFE
jgi:D-glycero-D-manno-heptose 1,7-bisphosphate phosphatase